MTYRTDDGRSFRHRPHRLWRTARETRYVILVACIAVLLGSFVGAHLYGRYLASREEKGVENALEQLRAENQKLKEHGDDLSAQITQLQTKLQNAEETVKSIMPTKDTYEFDPNQTRIVGDGHLTVGLIGSPGNETVTLSVNGRQQTLGAGQVLNVDPNCQVEVQSFDMFKAVVTASCAGQKQQ